MEQLIAEQPGDDFIKLDTRFHAPDNLEVRGNSLDGRTKLWCETTDGWLAARPQELREIYGQAHTLLQTSARPSAVRASSLLRTLIKLIRRSPPQKAIVAEVELQIESDKLGQTKIPLQYLDNMRFRGYADILDLRPVFEKFPMHPELLTDLRTLTATANEAVRQQIIARKDTLRPVRGGDVANLFLGALEQATIPAMQKYYKKFMGEDLRLAEQHNSSFNVNIVSWHLDSRFSGRRHILEIELDSNAIRTDNDNFFLEDAVKLADELGLQYASVTIADKNVVSALIKTGGRILSQHVGETAVTARPGVFIARPAPSRTTISVPIIQLERLRSVLKDGLFVIESFYSPVDTQTQAGQQRALEMYVRAVNHFGQLKLPPELDLFNNYIACKPVEINLISAPASTLPDGKLIRFSVGTDDDSITYRYDALRELPKDKLEFVINNAQRTLLPAQQAALGVLGVTIPRLVRLIDTDTSRLGKSSFYLRHGSLEHAIKNNENSFAFHIHNNGISEGIDDGIMDLFRHLKEYWLTITKTSYEIEKLLPDQLDRLYRIEIIYEPRGATLTYLPTSAGARIEIVVEEQDKITLNTIVQKLTGAKVAQENGKFVCAIEIASIDKAKTLKTFGEVYSAFGHGVGLYESATVYFRNTLPTELGLRHWSLNAEIDGAKISAGQKYSQLEFTVPQAGLSQAATDFIDKLLEMHQIKVKV